MRLAMVLFVFLFLTCGCSAVNSNVDSNNKIATMPISINGETSHVSFLYFMKINGSAKLINNNGQCVDGKVDLYICKQFVGYSRYLIEISIPSYAGATNSDGGFSIYVSSNNEQTWDSLANRVVLPHSYYTLTFSKDGYKPVTVYGISVFDDGIDCNLDSVFLYEMTDEEKHMYDGYY